MKIQVLTMLILLAATTCFVANVQAQLIRETGTSSISGTLQKTIDDADDYQLTSEGREILFADLDATVYINRDEHPDHEADQATTAVDTGGETSHEEGGGCSGPGGFSLELLDPGGDVICQAGKPKAPGWDTDPRMACVLENPGDYLLRVRFSVSEEHTESPSGNPKVHPYLLNLSLRSLDDDEPMMKVDKAIKKSRNRLVNKE